MKHLYKNSPIQIIDDDNAIKNWTEEILSRNPFLDKNVLEQALHLLELVGKDKINPYGETCLQNGLALAFIVSELGVDAEGIAAALLYGSVQYGDLPLENVSDHLGEKIARLIGGAKQLVGIDDFYRALAHGRQYQYSLDNIRKMFLAIVDDVVIVVIKLAERLYALRGVSKFPAEQQKQVAQSVAAIYAPLANRLGISQLKWEMEDLSFRYLEPDQYYKISKALKENRLTREKYIIAFIDSLNDFLKQEQIKDFKVTGRVKYIYSIYRKMQRKNIDVQNIYDINAVRIFVPTIADCYEALSALHNKWEHITTEFDDYIANPKPNGYRSIHTAIIGPEEKIVEIQIRTFVMHEESELGVAAHWLYKEGRVKSQVSYEEKIALLRQVMSWQEEVAGSEEKQQEIKLIFRDRVYVFTPQNDLLDLPQGSTPLDFAYRVHTEVGNRCVGAKINGSIVPLNYQLQTGDRIEILTSKRGKPSRDWLNIELGFLHTPHARAKVLGWLKKQNYDYNLEVGQELWIKEQRRLGVKKVNLDQIAAQLQCKNKSDMFVALGCGELKIAEIIGAVNAESLRDGDNKSSEKSEIEISEEVRIAAQARVQSRVLPGVQVQGIDNLLTHMASCCKPVPGDKVIGYITQGSGVSIHRNDCRNILRAQRERSERLLPINWGVADKQRYPVDIVVEAFDRAGLVRDITSVFADAGLMVTGLKFVVDKKEQLARVYITIEVGSVAILGEILSQITQVTGVLKAWRG